jgi:23S rRNA (adenine2503-C2)-methyltransferase
MGGVKQTRDLVLIFPADNVGYPNEDDHRPARIGRRLLTILGTTHDQFVEAFGRRYGKGAHIATPLYRQVMKAGDYAIDKLDLLARSPELAKRLAADLEQPPARLVKLSAEEGVRKFVTRLADNLDIESVVIPMFNRHTLCVSSQVGCRMGCRFCRTGQMGLMRNLTAAEIVGQVFTARHQLGIDVRNVVFMGMGEPLDNLENVVQAMRVLTDQRGFDIAQRHITVSTVGLVAGIEGLGRIDGGPVNLAVSLNAPCDDIRSAIMPINRSNAMGALRTSLLRYPLTQKASLLVGYVLIRGLNDRRTHAKALARYLAPMKVKLNLIAYNPFTGSELRPPSVHAYERFHGWLLAENIFVRRRGKKGGGIMAACGQLGGKGRFSKDGCSV